MKDNARGTSFHSAKVLIAVALASVMLAGGSAALASGDQAGGSAALASGDQAGGSAALASGDQAGGSAAMAGDKKSVFVSGNSTYSDCGLPRSDYALSLTGDLKGCLSGFIQGRKCKELKDYDLYFEEGREVFRGKLHGKQGRFTTTYTFEGAYARGFCQSFDPALELGGGCNHPIKGTSGVFADAEGLIKFIDVIAGVTGDPKTGEFHAGTGGNNFLYYGHIGFDQDN